jgi:hypothetical protein
MEPKTQYEFKDDFVGIIIDNKEIANTQNKPITYFGVYQNIT